MTMLRTFGYRGVRPAALATLLLLGACAQGQNYDTGTTSLSGIGLGTGGGAAAGALAGRALAGQHNNTLAMVGGALLGAVHAQGDQPSSTISTTAASGA